MDIPGPLMWNLRFKWRLRHARILPNLQCIEGPREIVQKIVKQPMRRISTELPHQEAVEGLLRHLQSHCTGVTSLYVVLEEVDFEEFVDLLATGTVSRALEEIGLRQNCKHVDVSDSLISPCFAMLALMTFFLSGLGSDLAPSAANSTRLPHPSTYRPR